MRRKLLSLAMAAILAASLTACSGGGAESSAPAESAAAEAPASEDAAGQDSAADTGEAAATDISGSTIEVAVTYTGDQATTFQGLVDAFEEETGVTVNIAEYGQDYENTMKTRMASNELPDVFQTHGWSLLRY